MVTERKVGALVNCAGAGIKLLSECIFVSKKHDLHL